MKEFCLKLFILVAFLLIIGSFTSEAQFIYTNDICSGAIPLPVGNNTRLSDSVFQRNGYGDTARSVIPDCSGNTNLPRHDLWYSFIATDTAIGIVPEQVSTSGLHYQLFSGTCGNLVSMQCNPDRLIYPHFSGLQPGQQYYIRTYYPAIFGVFESDKISDYKLTLLTKPVNDDCVGALLLNNNPDHSVRYTTERFSNAMSTAPVNTSCADNFQWTNFRDVWFKFVATSTVHTIYREFNSGTGGRMAIYSGQPGNFVSLFATSSSPATGARILRDLVVGDTYYIRVGALNVINFKLSIFAGSLPNNECTGADTVLMSNSVSCENAFEINRLGASYSGVACSGPMTEDSWYIFRATTPDITVKGFGDNASSLRFGLMDGSCGAITCLVSNQTHNFTYSGLTVGNYYYLLVGGSNAEQKSYACISPKITNDECSGAIQLPVKPYNVLRTTIGSDYSATMSVQPMAPCAGTNPTDVWFRFTATDTACLISVDAEKAYPNFQVLGGDCNTMNHIYCSATNPFPPGTTERTGRVGGLVAGNNYYVRVNTNAGAGSPGLFTIDINSLPSNDDCSGAIQLLPQQGLAFEEMESNGILVANTSLPSCAPATVTKDIWYKFTATQNSMAILSSQKTMNIKTLGLQVYNGGCSGLTPVACVQQTNDLQKGHTLTGLAPGQTYYIRQYGDVENNRISIIETPVNDEMADAIKLNLMPASVQPMTSYYLHGASKKFGKICNSISYPIHHDVWFYFIATGGSHLISTSALNSFGEDQDTDFTYRLEAFNGYAVDSASLVPKAIGCAAGSLTVNNLTAGDTVYVRISNTAEAGNTSSFGIKVANNQNIDEPTGALLLNQLNSWQYSLTTAGATQSLPSSGCLIQDFPDDDIWFSFIASPEIKRIIAGFENIDISMQLLSGTPGNLTAIQCTNNIMILPENLNNGSQYFVRAYSKANGRAASFRIGLFGEDDLLANNLNITCLGENMVQNPICESSYKYLLPPNAIDGYYIPGRKVADGWWSSTRATPDTWDADYPAGEWGNMPGTLNSSKDKIPRSGKGMLGVLQSNDSPVWTEYITGKLTKPLEKGKTYLVSFYVSMEKVDAKKAFNIGAFLGNDSIIAYQSEGLEVKPQITQAPGLRITEDDSWVNICGTFYADKAYSFITIGNFGNHMIYGGGTLRTYFYIDDVVVAEATCATLPLELLNFTGNINSQNQTELYWETAAEANTKNFEIEWHAAGNNFTKIGVVDATGNEYNTYRFLHPTPANGINYYRLKMFDIDGQFTYSTIVKTGIELKNNKFFVFPNPVSSVLNISVQADKDELVFFRLINTEGKVVAIKQRFLRKGSNAFNWDLAQLVRGTYFISSTDKQLGTVQVIKR